MSTKFVLVDKVKKVAEKFARRWVGGSGKEAEFEEDSHGWYAELNANPMSIYLGRSKPGLKSGDTIRITIEKV